MGRRTAIAIAKTDIVAYFASLEVRVFDLATLTRHFESQRNFWRLPQTLSRAAFIKYMVSNSELQVERMDFPARPVLRYTWGDVTLNEILMSIKPDCYFSHSTAIQIHDLTEQVAQTVYVSFEQTAKPKAPSSLTQDSIDTAFHRPTRISKTTADCQGYTVRLLNGMFTDNLGVIERKDEKGVTIKVTDVERTLIDITVRPEYAGGPHEVLKAFEIARDKDVSVNRLVAHLRKIAFVYPYYQVIGFYMARAGYRTSLIDLLRKFPREYDFYLMHNMKETEYSREWQLHYPKGF